LTLIILPAFNEAATIGVVINELRRHDYHHIVVVDDGSEDNTVEAVKKLGVPVIKLPYNMGAWKATQAGIRYGLRCGFNEAVTMDSDGQHHASEIQTIVSEKRKGYDLVIGSCVSRGSKGRKLTWKLLKTLSNLKINDITSGFRVYSRSAMTILAGKRASMLEYQDMGVLFFIKHAGLNYTEVDVEMDVRTDGISRIFHSWMAVLGYLSHTGILTLTKALPFAARRYRLKILEEGRSE
jgi:glycosyltransferase involved in cell wall biosynthesis